MELAVLGEIGDAIERGHIMYKPKVVTREVKAQWIARSGNVEAASMGAMLLGDGM